ncbi:MAG: iron-containing alcohol dehydrogenase [Bacteroidales bacterium OttesenSCG-928-I14]|jgi:alcohol dehydrogenase YqhD (iron-dependent ADH family)|nr:iron-containing alcohol dehydrogenase [Bacteroidales bacterium OttesenSCG-928-I14]
MNNFRFCSPTEFIFGKNTVDNVAQLIKQHNGTKVLIHYGCKSAEKNGLLDIIENSFRKEFIEYVKLGGVQPNPIDSLVYNGIELGREEKINFILAIGGGSVIDSAKAIAAGILYSGDFWDFFDGIAPIKCALPIGTILTLPAAGSEGSPNSVITKTDGMLKRGIGSSLLRPAFSIMDPLLTLTLPRCQTIYGIADMITHVTERYFTQTKGVDITDRICEAILLSIIQSSKILMQNPENYNARANIMWASTIAHNGICGVGREEDWATHALEHELSALYNIAHGAGLSVMLPAWMQYVYTAGIDRFVQFSIRVWNFKNIGSKKEIAMSGISSLKKFFQSIGLPTNFEQLGAKESDIDKLIKTLEINTNGKFGNFLHLTMNDARAIYKIASNS